MGIEINRYIVIFYNNTIAMGVSEIKNNLISKHISMSYNFTVVVEQINKNQLTSVSYLRW